MKARNSAVNGETGEKFFFIADAYGDLFSFQVDCLVANVYDAAQIDDVGPVDAKEAGGRELGQDRFYGHPYQEGWLAL